MKKCDDCVNVEICDWEVEPKTGKAKPIYWCEKYSKFCENVSECKHFDNGAWEGERE